MRRFLVVLVICSCRSGPIGGVDVQPVRVAPASLDFGQAFVGYGADRPLELTNPNAVPLDVALSGDGPFAPELSSLSVPAGTTLAVQVHFRPFTTGPFEGTLISGDTRVAMTGEGLQVPECRATASCRASAFDPAEGQCMDRPVDDGTPCATEDPCLSDARCVAGACIGTSARCDDRDACSVDTCGAQGCSHTERIVCPAPNDPCLAADCNAETGCGAAPVADGTPCGPVDCVRARVCIAGRCASRPAPRTPQCTDWEPEEYLKASNPGAGDAFGRALALSADGNTLAVSAWLEDSTDRGAPLDNALFESGAVYVFRRQGITWTEEAFVKPLMPGVGVRFGSSLALSADGSTLAAGAENAGTAWVFVRAGGAWPQQARLQPPSPRAGDRFGASLALSADGNTLAVGAPGDKATHLFSRAASAWTAQALLTLPGDGFGSSVALSADLLVVGAPGEDGCGAAHAFRRAGAGPFMLEADVKPPSCVVSARFGAALALSNDALAVGAPGGRRVYVFANAAPWTMPADLYAASGGFGATVALSSDGRVLAVGAPGDDTVAVGSGAVDVFIRAGAAWSVARHLKAPNADALDAFGGAVWLSADGTTLAAGATGEASNAAGPGADARDNLAPAAGAVYVF